jgi:hypothetical protein
MRGRIRSVKPELLTDEKLWDLGQETGLPVLQGFVGLWCMADREGRFEWRPRALKTGILPYWEGDFSRVMDALASRGFLVSYAVDGRDYGAVVNFAKHQTPNNREAPSEIPAPPEYSDIASTSTREPRVGHASARGDDASLSKKKSSGNGILGTGSWERDLGNVANAATDACPVASDLEPEAQAALALDLPPKPQEPLKAAKPPKPPQLTKTAALAALVAALGADARRRRDAAPSLSRSQESKVSARLLEYVDSQGCTLEAAAQALVASWAERGFGNVWKLCDVPFNQANAPRASPAQYQQQRQATDERLTELRAELMELEGRRAPLCRHEDQEKRDAIDLEIAAVRAEMRDLKKGQV